MQLFILGKKDIQNLREQSVLHLNSVHLVETLEDVEELNIQNDKIIVTTKQQ